MSIIKSPNALYEKTGNGNGVFELLIVFHAFFSGHTVYTQKKLKNFIRAIGPNKIKFKFHEGKKSDEFNE